MPATCASQSPSSLAMLLLGLAACGPEPAPATDGPQRVVLIVIDSTQAAQLGCYGGSPWTSPHLDRLAERGRRFAAAHSNSTWTLPSTVSLMTGQIEEHHGVQTRDRRVEDERLLLAERFQRAGWKTAAFVQMAYASDTYGLDQGFDEYHYFGREGTPLRDAMPPLVAKWMDAERGEKSFLYLHFRRPHGIYNPFPELLSREDQGCPLAHGERDAELAKADTFGYRDLDPASQAHVEHLYRANLSTVDLRLRPILNRALRDPECLVVLTSDHGEALGRFGYFGHGLELRRENVEIPLLFAGKGVAVGVDEEPVCTVDVLPTLLELCGLSAEGLGALDGTSLAGRLRGEASAGARSISLAARTAGKGPPALAEVRGRWKLVLGPGGRVRVYDRAANPEAEVTAEDLPAELYAALLERAQERRAAARERSLAGETVELDAGERADLEALGYLKD